MKNRLRGLRAERSWTQADLAQHVNVSRQTINAIEQGKFDEITAKAKAGCPISRLLNAKVTLAATLA